MTKEIWRIIKTHPDYAVSNHGRIKRRTKGKNSFGLSNGKSNTHIGRIRKTRLRKGGYIHVELDRKSCMVHQLVAFAFKGPRPTPKHEVAHWDGVRTNNVATNLRWATKIENQHDRRRHGTMLDQTGSKNHYAKTNEAGIRRMRRLRKQGQSVQALAKEYKMHYVNVSRICNGHTWRHVS